MSQSDFLGWMLIWAVVVSCWKLYDMTYPETEDSAAQPDRAMMPPGPAPLDHAGIRIEKPDSTLAQICRGCGDIEIAALLDGAARAYELILDAFARGNMGIVDYLVDDGVRAAFDAVIAERKLQGHIMQMLFIGISAADILDCGLDDGFAWIDIRFVGQTVTAVRDAAGQVVAGNPRLVVETAEIWTFTRQLDSADPNWLLTATDTDE